jgi:hypothetical protein
MEGYYTVHRATCQGCQARHLDAESHKVGPAESVWVTDESPAGFVPDPRMGTA